MESLNDENRYPEADYVSWKNLENEHLHDIFSLTCIAEKMGRSIVERLKFFYLA